MDNDECCSHGNILTTTCLRIQPCQDNLFFRRYGSMPHYMRSHRFEMSKNPFHLCRRYNYVLTVFSNLSPLTFRRFITYNQYSTVFPLTKSEECIENLSKQLHPIYFRQKQNDVTVRHIPFKLVCFATVVPLLTVKYF